MRSRSDAFVRIILLALALTLSAACLGAAAPASAGSGADPSGSAQALRALLVAEQARPTAADGAAYDYFGYAVAISGDIAVVGAPDHDVGTNADQGSVYVFSRSAGWSQQAKLTAADGAAGDSFGEAVAISGDTIVVGAPYTNVDQGSAYFFVRSGSAWSQQAQLTAADGAASDNFGTSVAISGETVVAGAPYDHIGANVIQGSACVFVRSGNTWSQQAQLTAAGGAAGDRFGTSVAISGATVVVGAPFDLIGANVNQGSAYVFVRSGVSWSQQATLTAADGAFDDRFGYSVAISGATVVVGAIEDDVGAVEDSGSAYVFVRSGATWSQQAKLTAADGARKDWFGWSVAISGASVVVGAAFDDVGANAGQGSAYIFMRSGVKWSRLAKLISGDAGDWFGWSVAISGASVVVGRLNDHVGGNADQGSVGAFRIVTPGRPVARSPKGRIISRTPILRWRAAAGAATYEVRIYKGSRLLKRQSGIVKTSWKCTRRLPRQAWLTWKVRARNVAGYGAYSARLRFRVR